MREPIEKVVKIVEDLNDIYAQALYDANKSWDNITYAPFLVKAGLSHGDPYVTFMDTYIWGGDDDMRKFDEEKNEYEDLHDYLITKACEILKQLNTGMVPLMIQTNDKLPNE